MIQTRNKEESFYDGGGEALAQFLFAELCQERGVSLAGMGSLGKGLYFKVTMQVSSLNSSGKIHCGISELLLVLHLYLFSAFRLRMTEHIKPSGFEWGLTPSSSLLLKYKVRYIIKTIITLVFD